MNEFGGRGMRSSGVSDGAGEGDRNGEPGIRRTGVAESRVEFEQRDESHSLTRRGKVAEIEELL